MSDPLSRAMADLAQKERDVARLQAEAEKLRSFVEMYRSYAEADKPASNGESHGGTRSKKKEAIANAAVAIIKRRGSPVPLSILYTEIGANGVEIGTSEPKQYLSTTLNRDSRFRSVKGQGWVLVD